MSENTRQNSKRNVRGKNVRNQKLICEKKIMPIFQKKTTELTGA